jgi:tRNA A22 N-methylase
MCGLSDRIHTRLSDGTAALGVGEADTIVVAGMGGELVLHILTDGEAVCRSAKELILQPQSEIATVRRYLREHAYRIAAEDMVFEDGKYYPMMRVIPVEENETRGEEALAVDLPASGRELRGVEVPASGSELRGVEVPVSGCERCAVEASVPGSETCAVEASVPGSERRGVVAPASGSERRGVELPVSGCERCAVELSASGSETCAVEASVPGSEMASEKCEVLDGVSAWNEAASTDHIWAHGLNDLYDLYGELLLKAKHPVLQQYLVYQEKLLNDILDGLRRQPDTDKIRIRIGEIEKKLEYNQMAQHILYSA